MSSSFVIVEGADGSGKTTLAEQLAERFGAEYEHVGPPRTDMTPFAEHIEYAFVLAKEYGQVVFDRFHLGCFAYGPIFRPENDIDGIGDFRRGDWDLFERMIQDQAFLVLCDPGWAVIEENVKARDGTQPHAHYEQDINRVMRVYERFEKGYDFSVLHKARYDYNEDEAFERLVANVEEVVGWKQSSIA